MEGANMNIIVLVKAVPDSEARMSLKPEGSGLVIEEKYELNYFDELAVEAAVRLKEATVDSMVTAITYGPKRAMEAVRKAVSIGAEGGIHVEGPDEALSDPLTTARILAASIHALPYDLILCGRKATDDDAAQVGPMVAELLGIPHVGAVVEVQIAPDQRSLIATRDDEGGQERVRCPIPALLTAQKGLNEPRVPTIQGVMRGMRLQPKRLQSAELGLGEADPNTRSGAWRAVGFREPPRRRPVRIIEGPDARSKARELVRILSEEIRILG